MTSSHSSTREHIKKLTGIAMFMALAYVTMFVFRIKVQGFLTFDAKDAIITVGAIAFGPLSGILISLGVALLEMVTVSDTGIYGFLMNFLSSATFSVTAALLYRKGKGIAGALLALFSSVLVLVATMVLANLFITPHFMGQPREVVIALLPGVLIPFNAIKGMANASLTMALYKPLSQALSRSGLLPKKEKPYTLTASTVSVLVGSLLVIAACLILYFTLFDGFFIKPIS